ncbi:hypothetical protein HBH56_208400 [Parastagonospora nodorum]|uniref:Uncharacterized protein n=1 Tax=Phaeosphaeria nodorum (strain SN15 / ATCC MYA-4574 / FGSC 10173) TaxID=321614 RepID=A0A7U2F6H1_PHANO|nr:hypothetical protein HBH56_208400 [Parastagonospora nodorum]QRC99624.1 hypothetical protein JI435_413730 [Parastagonospora nodorum SN15]KAH3923565.1 hypothetical protein HBH54_207270 [Parastagonospora nodorum]KAH3941626.1 hypothetical protein HBH53_199570 [Parastagonospora nodorum]KAH3960429.1 hypothetical protein HBH51_191790 [Parastagonospora nodorum]
MTAARCCRRLKLFYPVTPPQLRTAAAHVTRQPPVAPQPHLQQVNKALSISVPKYTTATINAITATVSIVATSYTANTAITLARHCRFNRILRFLD